MRYAWIHEHRDSYLIEVMCQVLQVSRSGFYRSQKAEPGPRAQRSVRIREAVAAVFGSSNQVYGSVKVTRTLESDPNLETACRNTVAKAMQEMGLKSRVSKKFRPSTTQADPSKEPAPNLLEQKFTATALNQKWVADITYLPTALGWVYLAVVLDLFSRKVVGWANARWIIQFLRTYPGSALVSRALSVSGMATMQECREKILPPERVAKRNDVAASCPNTPALLARWTAGGRRLQALVTDRVDRGREAAVADRRDSQGNEPRVLEIGPFRGGQSSEGVGKCRDRVARSRRGI